MSSTAAALAKITQGLPGGGEERPGQIAMAEAVDAACASGDALLVEAGTGTGMERGMRGELREGDLTIGEIEIIAVYAQGSRARILGGLSAPITFDTRARVKH